MSAAAKAIASGGLKRRAFSLGAVKAFDHAMQFLLPVVLVRCLDEASFGEYRLLWLVVGTVMALATLNMPGSLYYFLPRSDAATKKLYVHQTMLYLAAAGLLSAAVLSPWNPWLPAAVEPLARHGALVPAFVALWVTSVLLDYVPTIDERIGWQAAACVAIALARAVLLAGAAWMTGDLHVLIWMLLAVVVLKLALLVAYVGRYHGLRGKWSSRASLGPQLRYAVPFGVSSAFYSLRGQADQWVAASLFNLHSFAAFSIASILGQVVNIFRTSAVEAFLPSMSRMEAAGDVKGMMDMNARANVMVATLLYPLLGFTFVFADDIVRFVYTASYLEAAPVMRVYIASLALLVIEVGSVTLLLRQGPYALAVGVCALAISVMASWIAALQLGLVGAAIGSVAALYLDRALMLRRIAAVSGVPLARLQRWRALGRLLAWTAVSCVLAWVAVRELLGDGPVLARLALGAGVLALAYTLAVRPRRSLK